MDAHKNSGRSSTESAGVSLSALIAYAAPIAGTWFFYIPMWSILPGIYAKYFGLKLTAIAGAIVAIRLFDGVIDTAIGYLSDLHRERGGSRKTWVALGGVGTVLACTYLFTPPRPASVAYYLCWSFAFFLMFTISEIPHATWGIELNMDYQQRARIFGVRVMLCRVGILAFYAMPLLPIYPSTEYTPTVLRHSVYVGAIMTVVGLAIAIIAAPASSRPNTVQEDSFRAFITSVVRNRPLLLYFVIYGCLGVASGMWFGLVYFYLDSYLHLGASISLMFLLGCIVGALSTPIWLAIIRRTSKTTAWAAGIALFLVQLAAMAVVKPGTPLWVPFLLIATTYLYFTASDIASLASLGDIVDYGHLRFKKDRGATYLALNVLVFKFGLGLGGGLALTIAGLFGFNPGATQYGAPEILGLKLGFTVLPTIFAASALVLVLLSPITKRRHSIIQRRIERTSIGRRIVSVPEPVQDAI